MYQDEVQDPMIQNARLAIEQSSLTSSVYIGADSIRFKKKDKWFAKYSVVIILHKDSKHGGQLFHKSIDLPDYGNIKQRLLHEVYLAIETATQIIDIVGDRHVEIHLDLNGDPRHKSNVAVKEALGYVKGSLDMDAVIKPAAWAASHAADHVVRH
jgi:predicted RNase H-related nuclease YkuK (DUF458 family)